MNNKNNITIKEVAESAGVSRATVSRVLNDSPVVTPDTRARVQSAMDSLGYRPNYFSQALAKNRSQSIGLLVRSLGGHYFGKLMYSLEEKLTTLGQYCMVSSGHGTYESERKAVDFMLSRRVDAMILYSDCLSDEEIIEINNSGTPVVVLSRYIEQLKDQCIYFDDVKAGYDSTRHLLDNGHRNIATVTGPLHKQDAEDRFLGYKKALEDFDIGFDQDLVVESSFQLEGGKEATKQLLSTGKNFSAIYYGNDEMAVGGLEVLRGAGVRVPEDVSILGFEDIQLCVYLKPNLTTIRVPLAEMAHIAADLAMNLVNNVSSDIALEVQLQLIERESVTRPCNKPEQNKN